MLQHIRQLLPYEDMLYVADSGYAPYGCKDDEFVETRSRVITEYLLAQGAKVIVIACNTATASIIEKFRTQYGIPFVGVEPGIKPAIQLSRNGHVGVMATKGTLSSPRYYQLSRRFGHSVTLHNQACPGLADQVESGFIDTPETICLLEKFVNPLLEKQVDTIVLGCTHYSFLSALIRQIIGDSIRMVDTSRAIAEQVTRILKQEALQNVAQQTGRVSYLTTGSSATTGLIMSRLLEHDIRVTTLS